MALGTRRAPARHQRVAHDAQLCDRAFPHAGIAFSDMHIALAQAAAGDDSALEARNARSTHWRARVIIRPARSFRRCRTPSPLSSGGDFSVAIDALEPIIGELERIGGSRAQLDLVEFTLVKAYLSADRLDDARRMLRGGAEAPWDFRCRLGGCALIHETTATCAAAPP